MTRLWRYAIRYDSGAAPNYDPPMITLGICKPRIRRYAAVGDIVVAFAGAHLVADDGRRWTRHEVVWAGVVSEKLDFARYWDDARFEGKKPEMSPTKPDNIYRPAGDRLEWVENISHEPGHHRRDTSGRFVLAMAPSWRFTPGAREMPEETGWRMDWLNRRGERVSEIDEGQVAALSDWFNSGDSERLVHACVAGSKD